MKLLCIILIVLPFSFLWSLENFKSASTCGECHEDIFQEWKISMHGNASVQNDPLFRGMFEWAVTDTEGKLRKKCIVCHSPMSTIFQSDNLEEDFNREGVTCQFCHSVKEIRAQHSANDMEIDLTTIYSEAPAEENSAHPVAHREFFSKSEFCLPCHAEMKNPDGIEVCSTGEEWRTYLEQTQKQCQDCHMESSNGHPSHLFAGTHNGDLLNNSVSLELLFDYDSNELSIVVTNTAAGHALPTGTPLRMVYLKVGAYDQDGNLLWENWKGNPIQEDKNALFMRILGDADGNGPVPPWRATQTLYDRRLLPNEPVTITYTVPAENFHDVEVSLFYRLAPEMILKKFNITEKRYTQPRLLVQKGMKIAR